MTTFLLKTLKFGGVAFLILIAVIQLVPYGGNHTNPPVIAEPAWDSARTRTLFMRACADCHSNESVWPWYSNVAPVSWLVQRDVDEGRAKFNISEWGVPTRRGGDDDKDGGEGDEAAETVQEGSMPLKPYLLTHPSARLSASERDELIAGLLATFGGKQDD